MARLSTDMSIIEIDNLIKSLPKQRLQTELENPTGHFPLYLIAGRLKEMESMEADAQAAAAEKKTSEQPPSVAHRLAMMQEPVMSAMAGKPQPPPQQPSPAGQAAQMLTPTVNAARGTGGSVTSELVNEYLAELKKRKDAAQSKRLKSNEFAVVNRGSFAENMGEQPFGKGGVPPEGGLADLVAAHVQKEKRTDPTPTPSDQKTQGKFMGGVSRRHSQMMNKSSETEFDKLLEELIRRQTKGGGKTATANEGGYVGRLPTVYAQDGFPDFISPHGSLGGPTLRWPYTEGEVRRGPSGSRIVGEGADVGRYGVNEGGRDLGEMSEAEIASTQVSDILIDEARRNTQLGGDMGKAARERLPVLLKERSDKMLALEPAPTAPAPASTAAAAASASSDAVPNAAQLSRLGVSAEKFRGFSEGGRATLMRALNATTPFRISGAPSIIKNTLKQEAAKIRQAGSSPIGSIVNYFTGTPERAAEIKAESDAAIKTANAVIATANKEVGNTVISSVGDQKGGDSQKGGGPSVIPKAELSTDIRGEVHQPIITAKKVVPVSAEIMAANKKFLGQSVKDNVVGEGGSENKVKKLTDDGYNTLHKLFKQKWTDPKALGRESDLVAWQKDTAAANEKAYKIFRDIGTKSENATQSYIKSLETDSNAIKTFAETGKLPEGRRSQLLNNVLITFGAALLGNPTMAKAVSKGLMGSLSLQKGAEDDYADALNNNLKATKQIGDLKMKALEIASANKRDLLTAMRSDKKADAATRNQMEANIYRRKTLGLNIEKTILSQVMARKNYEAALITAQKPNAQMALTSERISGIRSLVADYKSQLDNAGNDSAKIQAVNEKFKNVFPKKKGLLYLDVTKPLDAGVNKYLKDIKAPLYTSKTLSKVDPVVRALRVENLGIQKRQLLQKPVQKIMNILGNKGQIKGETKTLWGLFGDSPAGKKFAGKRYDNKNPEQTRAFFNFIKSQPGYGLGTASPSTQGFKIKSGL